MIFRLRQNIEASNLVRDEAGKPLCDDEGTPTGEKLAPAVNMELIPLLDSIDYALLNPKSVIHQPLGTYADEIAAEPNAVMAHTNS